MTRLRQGFGGPARHAPLERPMDRWHARVLTLLVVVALVALIVALAMQGAAA